MNRTLAALVLCSMLGGPLAAQPAQDPDDLSGRVEVIRTAYGVPHIRAADLRAMGYALAWVQLLIAIALTLVALALSRRFTHYRSA